VSLLRLEDVEKEFVVKRSPLGRARATLCAVRGVSLSLEPGESLGIVGESGCGKTTLARLVLRLSEPTAGSVWFDGIDISHLRERSLRPLRRHLQAVFQDPYGSLNPRMRVGDIVAEPLRSFGVAAGDRERRVAEVLSTVGLSPDAAESYPHAFSGGQRQRIGIARALALRPRLLVCDEAVSSLDVSIQAQILNLLADIQERTGLALLFISHNLAVVRHLCHRIAVMYLGQVVELASESELFETPAHPYTRALLSAALEPRFDPESRRSDTTRALLPGEIPSPLEPPEGCGFRTRCPIAREECREPPALLPGPHPGHDVRCPYTAAGSG
jgi:peptide/nickel transport system ATP-binding protein